MSITFTDAAVMTACDEKGNKIPIPAIRGPKGDKGDLGDVNNSPSAYF